MKFEQTILKNVWLIKPEIHADTRGHFLEAFRWDLFKKRGLEYEFVQDNISTSKKNTLRGLHYQLPPASQTKLIMVPYGEILDVAVDARTHSPTFGQYFSTILNSENRHMMLIPSGFAHGFSVLSEEATILYKCSDYYNRSLERGIRWNDPKIDIDWKINSPILSKKDEAMPLLEDMDESDLF